jgi:uncharacterized membrane protein YhaH (DUF805 family)
VNFGQAIASGFRNYFNFTGRATRSEYWFFYLFTVIVGIALSLIFPGHRIVNSYGVSETTENPLYYIIALGVTIPQFSMFFRRLRDAGRPWYNFFWVFLPIIGSIILIVKLCQPSVPTQYAAPVGYGQN